MKTLDGKIALVSGGSKGIGAAIAKHLAASGAIVTFTYASSSIGADKTLVDIREAGGEGHSLQANFLEPSEISDVFGVLRKLYGRLDILVNNAGVYSFGPLEQVMVAEYQRQFDLNVLSVLLACKEAVGLFPPEGGSIINIGSSLGSMPPPSTSIYSATKAAVDSLTISLSKELGARNIRVNSLNPGLTVTEGRRAYGGLTPAFLEQISQTTPLGRIGTPDDVGPAAVFLCSDQARWVTGQRIIAAGGRTQ